jgi:GntR family transcriptional repressor for pyruvate dehydrogenase complex
LHFLEIDGYYYSGIWNTAYHMMNESPEQNLKTVASKVLNINKIERSATLSSQVTGNLEVLIRESNLLPGDRLPTERDLAERFEVSRTVIREAVRSLVARGMLEVRAGSGTIIRSPSSDIVSKTISLYLKGNRREIDLNAVTEVRRLIEVEIAGLAAERRTEEDIAKLKNVLSAYQDVLGDKEKFVKWDVSFHLRLASAAHNDLFYLLLDSISEIMIKVREIGFKVRGGSGERAMQYHTAIFKQVELGSRDGARQAMREHIEDSEQVVAQGLFSDQETESNSAAENQ